MAVTDLELKAMKYTAAWQRADHLYHQRGRFSGRVRADARMLYEKQRDQESVAYWGGFVREYEVLETKTKEGRNELKLRAGYYALKMCAAAREGYIWKAVSEDVETPTASQRSAELLHDYFVELRDGPTTLPAEDLVKEDYVAALTRAAIQRTKNPNITAYGNSEETLLATAGLAVRALCSVALSAVNDSGKPPVNPKIMLPDPYRTGNFIEWHPQ